MGFDFCDCRYKHWVLLCRPDVDVVQKKGVVIYLWNNLHKWVLVGLWYMEYFPFGNVCELFQLGPIFGHSWNYFSIQVSGNKKYVLFCFLHTLGLSRTERGGKANNLNKQQNKEKTIILTNTGANWSSYQTIAFHNVLHSKWCLKFG